MDVECVVKKVTSLESVLAREKKSASDVNRPVIVLQIALNPVLHAETYILVHPSAIRLHHSFPESEGSFKTRNC